MNDENPGVLPSDNVVNSDVVHRREIGRPNWRRRTAAIDAAKARAVIIRPSEQQERVRRRDHDVGAERRDEGDERAQFLRLDAVAHDPEHRIRENAKEIGDEIEIGEPQRTRQRDVARAPPQGLMLAACDDQLVGVNERNPRSGLVQIARFDGRLNSAFGKPTATVTSEMIQ